jgi:GSCFA family
MDKFHTTVDLPPSSVKFSYDTPALFMGSCFSDYIGEIMAGYKFPILMNPFGTIFNPISIAENLELLIHKKIFTREDLQFQNGLWFSFSHYTRFSYPDQAVCLERMNTSIKAASSWLQRCRFLVLTFGTAWAYHHIAGDKVVANCHKLPSTEFKKTFLEPSVILDRYSKLFDQLEKLNPDIHVVFTLSPVRHWADGAVNNQLSKSVLHYSIHEILKKHNRTHYFPSYEIFMDELRDYRFYAADMLHPSDQGTHYVWDKFCETWVDEPSKLLMAEIETITKAAHHRPLNADSDLHRKFQQTMLKKVETLVGQHSFLNFDDEIQLLGSC